MKYCKKCVMPDTRPGIKFNEEGICYPCLNIEKRKDINWKKRLDELKVLCDKYRKTDGSNDCIIAVSGGKDSYFQTYVMKELMGMNPLLVCVSDSYTHTEAGKHNLSNLASAFKCNLITYNTNGDTLKKMTRLAFETLGSPTWAVDLGIYSIPLKIAHKFKIPLIVYGENVAYEYGGPGAKETYSAKDQIKNDAVKPIDWEWWYKQGITKEEIDLIKYPDKEVLDYIDPIYLSYFFNWDGYKNYELAKTFGFKDVNQEWKRDGFIEHFDQIDSIGYVVHPQMKYPKLGHARATDVSSYWIRQGYITREEGIEYVKKHDHKFDQRAVDDFCRFAGYTLREFYSIVDKFYNKDIFEKVDGIWRLKNPIWK